MNKRVNLFKRAQNISIFLLLAILSFGLSSPTAYAGLSITTLAPTGVTYNGATLNGMLNEGSLTITAWFEYGTNPNRLDLTTNPQVYNNLGARFSTPLSNLYTGATYYYRAVAENSQGRTYGNILSFTTAYYNPNYDQNYVNNNGGTGVAPGVTTNGFSNATANSVVLSGFVNGNNLNTSAWFEYGTDSKNFTNSTTQTNYGAGVRNFNITLLDLKPNSVYYFRAVAQNVQGRTFGNIMSFATGNIINNYPNNTNTTTPVNVFRAVVNPATKVNKTSAQLNALIINANSTPSTTWFEWSDNQNNLNTKTESINTGALPAIRHANTITGLKPNTTYYFRAIADNGSNRVVSAVEYFITPNTTSTINTEDASPSTGSIIVPVTEEELSTINLGANALGTGFMPNSLPEWLLLIIFILLIMLITQYLFFPEVVETVDHGHGGHH